MAADDQATIRKAAIAANREAWDLLDKVHRTAAEDAAMMAAAERSLALWEKAGTDVNRQRGRWLVARVAVELGRAEAALDHAGRTLELTATHHDALADFDRAFAEEIAARAFALAGDTDAARAHYAKAKQLGEAIRNAGDRREFFRQFDGGPWFGLTATE